MDGNGRRRTRWMAAALGASTFFVLAGIAAARLTSESGSTTIAPQQNGTAAARCSSGTAVAGGFSAPGFDPTARTGPAILSFASKRAGDGKWKASGHNFNRPAPAPKVDPGAGSLVARAYCDRHDSSVTVRSKSTTVPPVTNGSLSPKCPRGSEAVSGGFTSDPANPTGLTAYAYTSKRTGHRAWTASFVNPDQDNPHSATAFAYCEKHGPKLVTGSESRDVQLNATVTATAKCPPGAKIFSGGYRSTFTQVTPVVSFALPFASRRASGDRWKVSSIGLTARSAPAKGTVTSTETALSYCET